MSFEKVTIGPHVLYRGDCREVLPILIQSGKRFKTCVSSPPYWRHRDYQHQNQIGQEQSPSEYVQQVVEIFSLVVKCLDDDGTIWLNLGDSYAQKKHDGIKVKDLVGIPWMVAFALRDLGLYLRQNIVWAKPNCMPGSQEDRCTSSHESIFLFSKSAKYWCDFDAIKTPPREVSMVRTAQDIQKQAGSHRAHGGSKIMKAVGCRDKQRGHSRRHAGFNERWDQMTMAEQQSKPASMRDVWFVAPAQSRDSHFAVMPNEVARRCVLAGSPDGGDVLDPFGGSGTVGEVCQFLGRNSTSIELNSNYAALCSKRITEAVNSGALFTGEVEAVREEIPPLFTP